MKTILLHFSSSKKNTQKRTILRQMMIWDLLVRTIRTGWLETGMLMAHFNVGCWSFPEVDGLPRLKLLFVGWFVSKMGQDREITKWNASVWPTKCDLKSLTLSSLCSESEPKPDNVLRSFDFEPYAGGSFQSGKLCKSPLQPTSSSTTCYVTCAWVWRLANHISYGAYEVRDK